MKHELAPLPEPPRYDFTAPAQFDGLTLEDWRRWWGGIARWEQASNWLYGDLFNAGRRFLPGGWPGACELSDVEKDEAIAALIPAGVELRRMKICGWVARAFPVPQREGRLSWSHHYEIWQAGVLSTEQRKWLARSVKENWSVADLRQALAPERRLEGPRPETPWFVPRKERGDAVRYMRETFPPGEKHDPRLVAAFLEDYGQPVVQQISRIARESGLEFRISDAA